MEYQPLASNVCIHACIHTWLKLQYDLHMEKEAQENQSASGLLF